MKEKAAINAVSTCVLKYENANKHEVCLIVFRELCGGCCFVGRLDFLSGPKYCLGAGVCCCVSVDRERRARLVRHLFFSVRNEALCWDQLQEEERGESRDSQKKNYHFLFRRPNRGFVMDL